MIRLIGYMATPGRLTGAPRRLLTLASALRREGIETYIATESGCHLLQVARAKGLNTASVDLVGVLGLRRGALLSGRVGFQLRVFLDLLRQNWRALRCFRRYAADAVWIRGSKGIAFAATGALLSGRPIIWDVDYELPSRGLVRWLHRHALWVSQAVVCQYAAAPQAIFGKRLADRYRARFRTIVPGIDLSGIEALRSKRRCRDAAVGTPFVILQVGTVCDRKNQAFMIEAFQELGQSGGGSGTEFWLAYNEMRCPELFDCVEKNGLQGKVKFLGWRDDVRELMAQADVLCMPSKDEGVPNAVQEAMAIGLPVLVSKAGGMPEIVRDGETGWVLEIEDPSDWADRIRWCKQHPDAVAQVGENAAAYACENFQAQSWGRQYAQVIAEVVAPARTPAS